MSSGWPERTLVSRITCGPQEREGDRGPVLEGNAVESPGSKERDRGPVLRGNTAKLSSSRGAQVGKTGRAQCAREVSSEEVPELAMSACERGEGRAPGESGACLEFTTMHTRGREGATREWHGYVYFHVCAIGVSQTRWLSWRSVPGAKEPL